MTPEDLARGIFEIRHIGLVKWHETALSTREAAIQEAKEILEKYDVEKKSTPLPRQETDEPSFRYDLELIEEQDGTLNWKE